MKYSIIIVGYKAIDSLNRCLRSLIANPPEREEPGDLNVPAEIILIDNSPEQLKPLPDKREFKKLLRTYVRFVHEWHPENLGFAAACNRGAELAGGEILVFVNPDTEVFPEWAERMGAHFGKGIGAVGPVSNFVAGWQNYGFHQKPADTWEKMAKYAIKGNNKRGVETKMLIGFFLMVKREAWDKVGGMDPQFFLGCDDLDLSLRLRDAGYGLIIASDVFVYHEGHKSFEESSESLNLNRQSEKKLMAKLAAKYGDAIPSSKELWGCDILPTHIPKRQTLSICMIVRNECARILDVVRDMDCADEIVVVDTGSEDGTDNLLLAPTDGTSDFGLYEGDECVIGQKTSNPHKRLYRFPWTDSFAEARNFALSKCTGDWVLWLDADDRVTPENAALIRAAMDNPGPRTQAKTVHFGFMLRDHGPEGLNYCAGHPRLFPRVPGLQWEGRVHESYIPAAKRLGIEKADCDNIIIDHYGYQDPAVMLKKHERNLRLMRMEEDSPKKFYHMGRNLQGLGHYLEAEDCYRKVLEPGRWAAPLDPDFRDHVRLCFASLIITVKGHACEDVDQYLDGNEKPDALFLRAEVALKRGQVFEAEDMYREYASWDRIIDPFGSQMEYFQRVAKGRLEAIQKVREQVYGESAAA